MEGGRGSDGGWESEAAGQDGNGRAMLQAQPGCG